MRWFLYAQNNEDDHKSTKLTSISLNFFHNDDFQYIYTIINLITRKSFWAMLRKIM